MTRTHGHAFCVKRLVGTALLCCFFFPLSACAAQTADRAFSVQTSAYARALQAALPLETFASSTSGREPVFTSRLRRHAAMEAYDAQAAPLMRAYNAYFWYAQYAATAVLAIDRAQTDAVVSGWGDLPGAGQRVGITSREPELRLLLCAMSHALDSGFAMEHTIELLAGLRRGGLLSTDDDSAPILICFDHEAAERGLEIVVPAEGTLTFTKGLLSRSALSFPDALGAALVDAGFRLPDGTCDEGLYPPAADYARAAALSDYTRLNEAGQDAWRTFRRGVLRLRFYSTADGREHMLSAMAFILLLVAWAGDMTRRVISRRIRASFFTAALLMALWAILRIFKYHTPSAGVINRYCWYGYYIFLLGLPLALLRVAAALGRGEDAPAPVWWKVCLGITLALLLMVLTNDLHMRVFQMDLSGDWHIHYRYRWGYFLVAGHIVLHSLAAIALLLARGRQSPRKAGMLIPVLFFLLTVAYAALYALRVPFARESDFTITTGFFMLLFLQAAILSGLVPVNAKYALLFARSPLAMEIRDAEGKPALCAAADARADAIMRSSPITGGTAIWREDLSAVRALQKELAQTVSELERANAMLRHEHRIRSNMEALAARKRVQAELDAMLGDQFARVGALLDGLGEDGAQDKDALARVGLLLCYGKRRCNLMFWKKEYRSVDSDALVTYLGELGDYARAAGVTCALIPALHGALQTDAAIACYGFLFDGLDYAAHKGAREIICRLDGRDGSVVMRLMADVPFDGLAPRGEPACRVELREDGYLYQAVLTIEGGAAYA